MQHGAVVATLSISAGAQASDNNTHTACETYSMQRNVFAMQVGRYGPEKFDFSRERVTASVSESLKRLQVIQR